MRGFACLWVTYCHAHADWCDLEAGRGLGRLVTTAVGIGGKGVDIFVVLSGFCLFYPVLRRAATGRPQRPVGEFYRRRALRILPVYFAAIAASLALLYSGAHIANYRGLWDLLPYLLLVQNVMPDYTARINGPLWSVALEAQLYVLFPALAFFWMRGKAAWILTLAGIASVVASFMSMRGLFGDATVNLTSSLAVPTRLIQFCFGMLAAASCARAGGARASAWAVAGVVTLPVALFVVSRTGAGSPLGIVGSIAWAIVGASAVVVLSAITERWTWTATLGLPLEKLGLISFSFYVLHFPILYALEPHVAPYITGPIQGLLLFTMTGVPVMLAAALALFWTVERHFVSTTSRETTVVERSPIISPLSEVTS